ncbi:hypothetical protein [Dyadobacter diqingensis]|uniref:hypothetical protein n=1 Tax=Dyadobacter diqingensis TaxID=2938121 RepID=UPI0020C2F70C|nr:hypothetical protein [Dyadobacter diqingensis]
MAPSRERTKICTFPRIITGSATGSTTGIHMMENKIEDGIVLARELFEALDARGKKWKARNVPVYLREHLWIPYYTTETAGVKRLFVIRPPDPQNPKVHFKEYS